MYDTTIEFPPILLSSDATTSSFTENVTYIPGNQSVAFGFSNTPSIKVRSSTTLALLHSLDPNVDANSPIFRQGIIPFNGFFWIVNYQQSIQVWDPFVPTMWSVYQLNNGSGTHQFRGNAGMNLQYKLIRTHELIAAPYTGEIKIWSQITSVQQNLWLADDDGIAPFVGFVGRPRIIATNPSDSFICTWAFDTTLSRVFCFKNSCEYTTQSGTSPVCHQCSTDMVLMLRIVKVRQT